MLVSIITPFCDEERTLGEILAQAAAATLPQGMRREFILVDDGSTDGSAEIAAAFVRQQPESAMLVRLPRNRGKGAAMRRGLASAEGDIVLVQDADLEWDPADYLRLLSPYADATVMAVYGSRLLGKNARCIYYHYLLGGLLLTACTNLLFGSRLTDEPTGMKSFRRAALDGIALTADGFDFERYLAGMHELWRNEPGWEAPLGIDYERPAELPALLVERGVLGRAAENLARDPRWRRVYADQVATVFVPTQLAEARGLAKAGP